MNLSVRVDTALTVPSKVALNCTGCGVNCDTGPTICKKVFRSFPDVSVELQDWRELPGTFIERIDVGVPPFMFESTYLEIEVDLKALPLLARACQLHRTDVLSCSTPKGLPSCAIAGEVVLSNLPNKANMQTITGRFAAKFVDGLIMEGAF